MTTPGRAAVALVADAARLDRTQSDPVVAARNALGVAVPMIVAAALGSVAAGLPSAIGALQTAFADRPGPYRLRVLRMGITAVASATTSALAVALSDSTFASATLLLVVGFIAGLLLSAGPGATQVGVAATAAALVLGHQAQRPGLAIHVGVLVLAGGAVQVVLAIAAWPLRRHSPERRALAGLYDDLAGLADHPAGTAVGPPLGVTLAGVRATLYGLGHDHGPSVEAYRVLLDEAERVRRELLLLGGYAEQLDADGDPTGAAAIGEGLHATADVLRAVGSGLREARPLPDDVVGAARARLAGAESVLTGDGATGLVREAATGRLQALTGQLRAVVATTRIGASEGRREETSELLVGTVGSTVGGTVGGTVVGTAGRTVSGARLRDPIATALASLTPSSAVFRHAVRVGVLVGGTDLVLRAAGVDRGYWVSLTVLVVLRPDFATTLQRSTMRVAGTIVGLVLATVLTHFVPGGPWFSIALIALFFFGMRLAGPGNLALGAVALSALVVTLLSLAGVPAQATVWRRGLDTLIGGALAIVAVLLGASWERDLVAERAAELLEVYRRYTVEVADLSFDPRRLQRSRMSARLARTNAQASVDRAGAEPVTGYAQVQLGQAVLAHSHRYVHAVLTIDALRPQLRAAEPLPELGELLSRAAAALDACAAAVRAGTQPQAEFGLRNAQRAVTGAITARAQSDGTRLDAASGAALIEATDRVVNSLDTLIDELRRQLGGVAD